MEILRIVSLFMNVIPTDSIRLLFVYGETLEML